jgi:hypothetical protein
LTVDESFEAVDFDGTRTRRGDGLDVLYVASHGELRGGIFRLVLHHDDWSAAVDGLDGDAPCVVVFDACNLVDVGDPNWGDPWTAVTRPRLRLVCGFASNATVGKGPARRGLAFAQALWRDEAVAAAWIDAVASTKLWFRRADKAVAIGFGSTDQDAAGALTATLSELQALPPLTGTAHVAVLRG